MNLTIVIASGKGGTGKTFVAANLARTFEKMGEQVRYLDCDVEEPNGRLFLKPVITKEEEVILYSPADYDAEKCRACGLCVKACRYHALALVKEKLLFFRNLCHVCGACTLACPENAIIEEKRKIGLLKEGRSGKIDFYYGLLETGEGSITPRLIKRVRQALGGGINIIDSQPGTACPVVETVRNTDLCVLVTDPTPFGIHDLKLAVDMCRVLQQEPVVLINRAEYMDDALKTYCRSESLVIIGEIPDDRAIAECYSVGNLVVDQSRAYYDLFRNLSWEIVRRAGETRKVFKKPGTAQIVTAPQAENGMQKMECSFAGGGRVQFKGREFVVISGKGGTGKTSLAAAFCALEKKIAIADCDVDAADLHLVLHPEIQEQGGFSGGDRAVIDPARCTACGKCYAVCRFAAVKKEAVNGLPYSIEATACEGCGACSVVCAAQAITFTPVVNGEWYLSRTRFGPLSHARLGAAEENSGKLVSLVRNNRNLYTAEQHFPLSLVDGSPGTGCPVMASLTGSDYAVVVTEPTVSGIHDLKRVLDVIAFFKIRAGIVVNKYDINPVWAEKAIAIAAEYHADFLGMLSYDKVVTKAQVQGVSVIEYAPDSELSREIAKVWDKVKETLGVEQETAG